MPTASWHVTRARSLVTLTPYSTGLNVGSTHPEYIDLSEPSNQERKVARREERALQTGLPPERRAVARWHDVSQWALAPSGAPQATLGHLALSSSGCMVPATC